MHGGAAANATPTNCRSRHRAGRLHDYLFNSATAALGAILLTGCLGSAIATHVRTRDSLFSIILPVIIGVMLWGGLYLRNEHLRSLVPVAMKIR